MTWSMYTFTGRKLKPTAPTTSDIDILDIAHALSMICRYNGHSKFFYSVAQHSVLMSNAVPDKLKKVALMHDAAEYILGDVASPVKQFLNGFEQLEHRILQVIFTKYDVKMEDLDELMYYDKAICIDEMAVLMTDVDPRLMKEYKPLFVRVEPWEPEKARTAFLDRFNQLFPGEWND